MTRLFDAGKQEEAAKATKARQEEVRKRAEEADAALRELGLLDNQAEALHLRKPLESVQAIRYDSYRKPGGRVTVEHAAIGRDYVFQVFPLRPPTIAEADILLLLIATMDGIFPRSIHITYTPPADLLPQKFYTVKVLETVNKPGWQEAIGRALLALSQIDAWPEPKL